MPEGAGSAGWNSRDPAAVIEKLVRRLCQSAEGEEICTRSPEAGVSSYRLCPNSFSQRRRMGAPPQGNQYGSWIRRFLAGIAIWSRRWFGTTPACRRRGGAVPLWQTRCGQIFARQGSGEQNYFCERRSCKFGLWRDNRFLAAKKISLTKKMASSLLTQGRAYASGIYSEKTGKTYDAFIVLEDDGARSSYKLDFTK